MGKKRIKSDIDIMEYGINSNIIFLKKGIKSDYRPKRYVVEPTPKKQLIMLSQKVERVFVGSIHKAEGVID